MSPDVHSAFERMVDRLFASRPPSSVMEVGASHEPLLDIPRFGQARRVALNIAFKEKARAKLKDCELIEANGNSIPLEGEQFDCIVSSSTLEHDRAFWRTVAEVRRLLRRGGVFIVGVPIYMELPTDIWRATLTFAVHGKRYNADFYRFSEQAVREVLLEGFELVEREIVHRYPSPYIVAAGRMI